MPLSLKSQVGDGGSGYEALMKMMMSSLRVSLPGIIQSFDPETVTCIVQPAVRGQFGGQSATLPLLVDVPVIFPSGGGVTLTFPVTAGDECLVIFADRCIDFWWQNGGIQEPVDNRMHDLSDAFVIPGPQSQAQKIGDINTSAAELRSDDGLTKFSLNPTTGAISATAPGGFDFNGLKVLPDGRLQLVDGSIVDEHTHGGVESGGSRTSPLGA